MELVYKLLDKLNDKKLVISTKPGVKLGQNGIIDFLTSYFKELTILPEDIEFIKKINTNLTMITFTTRKMRNIIFYNKKILKNTGIMIFEALDKDQLEIIRALKKTQKSKNISYWTSHCKIFMKIKYLQCEELIKEIKSINDIDFYINYVDHILVPFAEQVNKRHEYVCTLYNPKKVKPSPPWQCIIGENFPPGIPDKEVHLVGVAHLIKEHRIYKEDLKHYFLVNS